MYGMCGRRLLGLAVGALGISSVMTQLALMRELLGAFSGNEMVLGVVLGGVSGFFGGVIDTVIQRIIEIGRTES